MIQASAQPSSPASPRAQGSALGGLAPLLLLLLLLLLLVAFLPGCSSAGGRGGGGGGSSRAIGELHLFGLPAALTIPGTSLPGGVGVRVFASEPGGARGLPILLGQLDVLLFDKPSADINPLVAKPLKVWSFKPPELVPFRSDTMMGAGYQLELRWNQERPKGKVLTVVARYRNHGKPDVYSTPAVIVASPR